MKYSIKISILVRIVPKMIQKIHPIKHPKRNQVKGKRGKENKKLGKEQK